MRSAVPEDLILISEAFEKIHAIIDPMGGNQDAAEDEWWYRQEQASDLLRLAVSEGSLVAFTYDSRTSQTVQLDCRRWTSDQWIERLSPDGWHDFELAENANPSDEYQYDKSGRGIAYLLPMWLPLAFDAPSKASVGQRSCRR